MRSVPSGPSTGMPLNQHGHEADEAYMARSIGRTLRDLRRQRGLTLSELARSSGVSSSMLSQIENGHSTPTVSVLWKIAKTFGVPITRFLQTHDPNRPILIRRAETIVRISAQGKCSWRALMPTDLSRKVEFYEIILGAGGIEDSHPTREDAWANLALATGEILVILEDQRHRLLPGDTMQFPTHLVHRYLNPGQTEAVMYLVISRLRQAPTA